MQPYLKRRIGTWLTTILLGISLVGCTAGDWRYDSPPAAGVQRDVGPIKARNILLIADSKGLATVLGTLTSSQPVNILGAALGDPNTGAWLASVPITGDIPQGGAFNLEAAKLKVTDPALKPGLTAKFAIGFSDGTNLLMDVPVLAADHPDYQAAWKAATG